ncbi:MAG: arylesterase [Lactobacillales bacterium]|jgi:acyl-CoA thioesterase-1|nr:arylesterase [Lactobacillales bacterium]
MKFLIFILVSFLFSAPVRAQEAPFRIIVFGDSLSAGYNLSAADSFYGQLEKALTDKGYLDVKVINASKNGETTRGALQRINTVVGHNPDTVLLELGINDAFRKTPVKTIEGNLEKMITTFKSKNIPILLIGMQAPPILPADYRKDFENMYANLAKKHNVTLYPFFMKGIFSSTFGVPGMLSKYVMADGAHPTAEGVGIMVKNLMPTLEKFLAQFE